MSFTQLNGQFISPLARGMASYYTPFTTSNTHLSDESDSDTDSDSSGFTDSTARKLDDPRYAIIRAAGPSLDSTPEQLFYQNTFGRGREIHGYAFGDGNMYDPSTNFVTNIPYLPFVPPSSSSVSSLFSFSSTNRDARFYPSPLFFTIKTPRTYKNITQIQFVQILFPNFLNSIPDISALIVDIAKSISSNSGFTFSNCYSCFGNLGRGRGLATSLNGGSFSEAGRVNPVAPLNPLVHTFSLKGGTGDPGAMINEMEKQLNTTPPFNLISYADHRQLFLSNGNADHLFNDPGKWYYSITSGTYVRNVSKSFIITDYLPHTRIENIQPTERELFVAYFFPVLKAAMSSDYDSKFLTFGTETEESVKQRVLQIYEGLSSPLYYDLCYANLTILKSIRRVHTFEYNPINNYTYTFNSTTKELITAYTDLHPSLHKEIQTYYETSKVQTAASLGLKGRDLQNFQTRLSTTGGSVATLSNQIQTVLVEVGVPLYTLTVADLANPATPVFLQTKKALTEAQTAETEEALIALTVEGAKSSLSPPAVITRSFPASFGWNTLGQLVQDASNAATVATGSRAFTVPYLQALQTLQQTNFVETYTTFLNQYSTNLSYVTTAQTIQKGSLALTSNYVNTKYKTIFPPSLLENNAYLNGKGTGGVTFYGSKTVHIPSTPDDTNHRGLSFIGAEDGNGCCALVGAAITNFYGCLPAEYVINTPFYKLGYGLNDILNFYSTNTLTAKITTNNVYVQLNEVYSLNSMDVAGNEVLDVSNETTGEYKKVFGRILTSGLAAGATAQTIVQIPARFPIAPLASLDHFTFSFLLDTLAPLHKLYPFNSGQDWNAIMQIDERISNFGTST